MKVLIDTNIILDFLLEQELFLQDAEALFQVISSRQIIGYIARRYTQSFRTCKASSINRFSNYGSLSCQS